MEDAYGLHGLLRALQEPAFAVPWLLATFWPLPGVALAVWLLRRQGKALRSSSVLFGLSCASAAPFVLLAYMLYYFPPGQGQAIAAALVGYPLLAVPTALVVFAVTALLHLLARRVPGTRG